MFRISSFRSGAGCRPWNIEGITGGRYGHEFLMLGIPYGLQNVYAYLQDRVHGHSGSRSVAWGFDG